MKKLKDLTPIDVINELIEGLDKNLIDTMTDIKTVIAWLERQKKYYK